MKNQFDDQLSRDLSGSLDSVHASEELIRATLKRVMEEQAKLGVKEDKESLSSSVSAIDPSYISGHITSENRRNRLRNIIIAFAATAALIAGMGFIGSCFIRERHEQAAATASADCCIENLREDAVMTSSAGAHPVAVNYNNSYFLSRATRSTGARQHLRSPDKLTGLPS